MILQGTTDHCHLIANRSLHGHKCYISAFTPFESLQPCYFQYVKELLLFTVANELFQRFTLNSSNIAVAIPCQDPHPDIRRLTYNIYSSVYHYQSDIAVSFSI